MAHKKDNGLVREMQKILLDDSGFLKSIIQQNLQQILEAGFASKITKGQRRGRAIETGVILVH